MLSEASGADLLRCFELLVLVMAGSRFKQPGAVRSGTGSQG
jgi:hypothetical protein